MAEGWVAFSYVGRLKDRIGAMPWETQAEPGEWGNQSTEGFRPHARHQGHGRVKPHIQPSKSQIRGFQNGTPGHRRLALTQAVLSWKPSDQPGRQANTTMVISQLTN